MCKTQVYDFSCIFPQTQNLCSLTADPSCASPPCCCPFLALTSGTVPNPQVANLWWCPPGTVARLPTGAAWPVLERGGTALDAVEQAGIAIENDISCCVGLGANPDRDGHVTLDACIMDERANCGSVAFLERIKHPVSVARRVMEQTPHCDAGGSRSAAVCVAKRFALESNELSPTRKRPIKTG